LAGQICFVTTKRKSPATPAGGHLPSRADLIARPIISGMGESQQAVVQVLAAASDVKEGVQYVVRKQRAWVQDHSDWARLLYGDSPEKVLLSAEPVFGTQTREYVDVVGGWLRQHAQQNTLRNLPFGIAHALWLGPTQEFCGYWLRGRSNLALTMAAPDPADGAWRALVTR